jgi:Flp pilus assembly protein TadD
VEFRSSSGEAFGVNPRNAFIALRLSQAHELRGEPGEAKRVLEKGLNANNSDRRLHFAFAKLLMK